MSVAERSEHAGLLGRLADQPYLLLALTSLLWAGNAVIGRMVVGHVPPVTLSFLRWAGASLIVLPFAWRQFAADWPLLRRHFGQMVLLSFLGVSAFNTLQYTALEHTQALNVMILQSIAPLLVGVWSLLLLRVRLSATQFAGMLVSMVGALLIMLKGDMSAFAQLRFNGGDLVFLLALAMFGAYSVLSLRRPPVHSLSFLLFTFVCGAVLLVPLFVAEQILRPMPPLDAKGIGAILYVIIFPSCLAYWFYNRGVALIGANRAAPFFHLIPVFGAVMAIALLGERIEWFHIAGFVLVLAGVVAASRKAAPR